MNLHGTRVSGLIAAGLIATAIGMTSYAAEPPGSRHEAGTNEMRPGMHMQRELERLHKDLGLDKNQEALFQTAREASGKAMREGMQDWRARRDKTREALNAPNPDLRALAVQMDKEQDEHQQKHRQVRDAWLNLYDSLNPAQKEKARRFIIARMDHMQERMRGEHPSGMKAERDDNRSSEGMPPH